MRIVHYLNQFFAGKGGEEKANMLPEIFEGAIGPGIGLQKLLGEKFKIVATIICGDNYITENMDSALEKIIPLVERQKPEFLIAGPAFLAGRYGMACGGICKSVSEKLGILAIAAMHPENPGVDLYHMDVYIVSTGSSIREMNEALYKIARFVTKIAEGKKLNPIEDGYIPRGIIENVEAEKTGAQRVIEMLLSKIRGQKYESEVSIPKYDRVIPALSAKPIKDKLIAIVTDGGLVPKGNPDRIESINATHFGMYNIEGKQILSKGEFEVSHSGYESRFVVDNPNRLVPLDALRFFEDIGRIGKIHHTFFSTTGVGTGITNAKKMGQKIANILVSESVGAVILTST